MGLYGALWGSIAFADSDPGLLQQKNPNVNYVFGVDFLVPQDPVPVGNIVGFVTAVDYNSTTSGCEASDFAGFPVGNIALVKRGTCSFAQKVLNAQAAGASGVLIANSLPGLVGVSLLNAAITVPVLSISGDLGNTFATTPNLRVHIQVKDPNTQ